MFRPRRIVRRGAPLLRGALVGGAGYLIGRSAVREDEHDDAIAQPGQPQPGQPSRTPPAAPDVAGQLAQLTDLHSRNVLSDAEFAAAKARLLNT